MTKTEKGWEIGTKIGEIGLAYLFFISLLIIYVFISLLIISLCRREGCILSPRG